MSRTVCIAATSLGYPQGSGHLWMCLNWALGVRALGCRVIWLESARSDATRTEVETKLRRLRSALARYGLEEVALAGAGRQLPDGCARSEDAAEAADLLLNFQDDLQARETARFRRTALMDIDPGLRQMWIASGTRVPARHDAYFTIGETVGTRSAHFPDCGIRWQYTPPAVYVPAWPVRRARAGAAYTTVAHWWGGSERIGGRWVPNDKRLSFLECADVPRHTSRPLELALGAGDHVDSERAFWGARGWRVTDAWKRTSTPWDYQTFIQRSRGEFSCAKPSCMLLENAWVSDRTLCYLASGKPAIVQHTGRSRVLPEDEGVLRFRTPEEAVLRLEQAEADYDRHCAAARRLAEEVFDATKLAARVLERAL